ncbi:hypothetical protein FA13DRAFT_1618672 [Coprinellus micaceus]|uniref:DUF7598 domain-containing protein n=1 Tax=Coprinellus micaceus TaxID=71717 RepID=A0A4Y7TZS0_COPMI|nr:hypothetical protein FA13DRAFT_1618672 [Coprinellus micaceus]
MANTRTSTSHLNVCGLIADNIPVYFFGLNGVRFLSIVSLMLVFASSILVMVTNIKAVNAFEAAKGQNSTEAHSMVDCDYIEGSTVPNQPAGAFWAVVATLLIIFQTIILFLSEVSWPMSFFDRFFPVLGSEFGLGALGIFQGLIATQILSHHVDDFTLVAAFFLFALGCVNMLLGLIFRQSAKVKRSIRRWRAEKSGVLPTSNKGDASGPYGDRPAFGTPVTLPGYQTEKGYLGQAYGLDRTGSVSSFDSTAKSGMGFGRQGEKAAGLRGFMLQKPEESLPRYVSPPASTAHGRVTRSNSTSSSWSSPTHYTQDTKQSQLREAIMNQVQPSYERSRSRARAEDDDEDMYDSEGVSRSSTPGPRHAQGPAFKSSQTAL